MDTQVKNAVCCVRCRRPSARPVPHGSNWAGSTYRTYHILTAQQEPYRITKITKIESSGKKRSQENGPLALLPAPKCLLILVFIQMRTVLNLNLASYLGCPSTTFSLALFTMWLATVQNWMLVALHRFVNSAPVVDGTVCPTSTLQPVHSLKWRQVITWYKSGTVIGCLPLCTEVNEWWQYTERLCE